MEASFRALSGGPGALPAGGPKPLAAGRPEAGRYAATGRLLITCPDQPGIVAAVSSYLIASGANITESQQYSTDPFGGTFFLRVEFNLDALADRFGDLAGGFGELADRFSMRWKMTRASELKRVAIMVPRAGHADRVIVHQNTTIVST